METVVREGVENIQSVRKQRNPTRIILESLGMVYWKKNASQIWAPVLQSCNDNIRLTKHFPNNYIRSPMMYGSTEDVQTM